MENYLPLLQVLLGGLLATLGGIIGIRLQAKYARKIKMDEITAEKKVIANAEAYSRIKKIASMFIPSSLEDTLRKILEYEEWFFNNRLFLPGKFPDKWLTLRNGIAKLVRLSKQASADPGEATEIEDKMNQVAEEAIEEIYKEMGLKEIKIEPIIKKKITPKD